MRIVMLIHNDWRYDSRVIREALTLVGNGNVVDVFCRRLADEPRVEVEDGVTYTITPFPRNDDSRERRALVTLHLAVLSLGARLLFRPNTRRIGARSALHAFEAATRLGVSTAFDAVATGISVAERFRVPGASAARLALGRVRSRLDPLPDSYVDALRYVNEFARSHRDRIIAHRPEVVHANDLVTLSAGVLASRRLSVPLIYDVHELEAHTNYRISNETKCWIGFYERVLSRFTAATITVCDSIADWLEREYAIERPAVVMNAPSAPSTRASSDLRATLGLDATTPLIVYVGSVTIDRGLEFCVEALADLRGVHLATVGPRDTPTEERMLRTAERFGVGGRLHLVDPVPSNEVIPFISTATLSVIPIQNVCLSYYYCFPNKLLESVLAGLPVAVASLVELERFVSRYAVGVVMNERTPEGIAAGISTILADPTAFAPTQEQIRDIVTEFGWDVQQRRLAAVYERIGHALQTDSGGPTIVEAVSP